MELQTIGRAVRDGQNNTVLVATSYLQNTINMRHVEKHQSKIFKSHQVIGDSTSDECYTTELQCFKDVLQNLTEDE
jgi:hypothetical protein